MKIKSIHIENVRGISNKYFNLNVIPNKPSFVVAPNGTGKSSITIAFKSLSASKLKLDDNECYNDNKNLLPVLEISFEDNSAVTTCRADKNTNSISSNVGVFVINNQLKANTIKRRIGGISTQSSHIGVEPIILRKVPTVKILRSSFVEDYNLTSLKRGIFLSTGSLFQDNNFIINLGQIQITSTKRLESKIAELMSELSTLTGTVNTIKSKIEDKYLSSLKTFSQLELIVKFMTFHADWTDRSEIELYLGAISIFHNIKINKAELSAAIEYAKFRLYQKSMDSIFNSLRRNWKDIHPHIKDDNYILEIGRASKISNGERDVLVFIAMLELSRSRMRKSNNILIIDEIFDYLDESNLVTAQYYITKFIESYKSETKNIFPLIMTHVNPEYFHNYYFSDMKVYYLNELTNPNSSDNILQLLRLRNAKGTLYDNISKYLLHFNDNDSSIDFSSDLNEILMSSWGVPSNFTSYIFKHLDNYVNNRAFDYIAISCALRKKIEKYAFDCLTDSSDKNTFLEDKKSTVSKLDFVKSKGHVIPEVFYLLGIIYNESLHLQYKNGLEKDLKQLLAARLDNKIIKQMIEEVVAICNCHS